MPQVSVLLLRAFLAATAVARLGSICVASDANDKEAVYTQDITKRADKIVTPLGLSDEAQRTRVRDLIVQQYRSLRDIHGERDAKVSEAKHNSGDAGGGEAGVKTARDAASLKLSEVHRKFVARLSVELTPEQMDKVKDGMTYGVVGITYKRYLELFPKLKDEDKREILADLVEAREFAMDGGTSEEKHAVFGKFKGRINNYLSKAGYDMKQAEKNLAEKQKSASQSR